MSLISWWTEYNDKRTAEKDADLRRKGFGWAMTEFFYSEMCMMEIESHIRGDYKTEFDYGAQDAVDLIKEFNYQKPEIFI